MRLPPFDMFPEIISDSIILRQILPEEIGQLLEISFYDAKPATTEQEALEMLHRIDADYENGTSIHWGIINRSTDEIVGTCGYYRGFDQGVGELGCILRPSFRGQGYMTSAMELAIAFGQQTMQLNHITAITGKGNDKAIGLLRRLNFMKTADLPDEEVEYQLTNRASPGIAQPSSL